MWTKVMKKQRLKVSKMFAVVVVCIWPHNHTGEAAKSFRYERLFVWPFNIKLNLHYVETPITSAFSIELREWKTKLEAANTNFFKKRKSSFDLKI